MSQEDRLTGLVGFSGVKVPVRAASTGVLTLSGEQTVDGVALVTDDRVLVKNQASSIDNGIYVVDSGDWSRAADADGPYDFVQGSLVPVYSGTANGGSLFQQTTADPVAGTSALTFVAYLTLITTPIPVAQGGTGAATAAAARASLGAVGLTGNESIGGDKAMTGTLTMTGKSITEAEGASVTSAATINIWATDGNTIHITGATGPISDMGAAPQAGAWKKLIFDSTPTLTQGTNLNLNNGGSDIVVEAGDMAFVYADTTAQLDLFLIRKSGASVASSSPPIPMDSKVGGTLSNNTGDATNDIDITAGKRRNSTDAVNMTLTALTKRLDANWAAGTNQGMRNSAAAITDTTYDIYAAATAAQIAAGTCDYYAYNAATSVTVATVLAALQAETGGGSYLYLRRIGSIVRAGATILGFVQDGDDFMLKTPVLDINAGTTGTTAVTRTLASVPIGHRVRAKMNVLASLVAGGASLVHYLSDLSATDVAASETAAPLGTTAVSIDVTTGTNAMVGSAQADVWTNTSAQIRSRTNISNAGAILRIATLGWTDPRLT